MTHAFVTGASGFIGTHLVQRLRQRGYDVTCLVRPGSDRSRLLPFRPRFLLGDVCNYESLQTEIASADVVYHLAGATKCLRARQFEPVNVDGVGNVATACAHAAKAPLLVLVSSLAAAGPSIDGRPRVETDPPAPVSHYGHSKLAGERVAMRHAADIPLTIVRPPMVLGEGDRDGLAMFETIAKWRLHLVPGLKDEFFSVIHAADLATALIQAAERGERVGRDDNRGRGIYYATAEQTPSYADLGRMIGRACGHERIRVIHHPKSTVWSIASINQLISLLRGRPHILNRDKAKEATAGSWACSSQALQRDTGFMPAKPLPARLAQTVDWYVQHRWLPLRTIKRPAPNAGC